MASAMVHTREAASRLTFERSAMLDALECWIQGRTLRARLAGERARNGRWASVVTVVDASADAQLELATRPQTPAVPENRLRHVANTTQLGRWEQTPDRVGVGSNSGARDLE